MRSVIVGTTAMLLSLAACSKTPDGQVVIERPGEVQVKTTQDTLHLPSLGTKTDTVQTPVIGVQKETLIVDKPVIGTKPTAIQRPTIKP